LLNFETTNEELQSTNEELETMNRLRLQGVSIGTAEHGKDVIILMQELGSRPVAPTRH
jgi:hypothetical protein